MQVEEAVTIELAPEQLWPWIAEPARRARWMPEESKVASRVERSEPVRELVLKASGLPQDLEVRLTISLAPQGTGTRLVLLAEAELTGLMIFAEKMIAAKGQAKLQQWAQSLRGCISAG